MSEGTLPATVAAFIGEAARNDAASGAHASGA